MASTDDRDAADAIDLTTRVRRRVLPTLHRIKEPFGGFAQCLQHPDEYVGTIPYGLETFRADLEAMAFEPEPIASLKIHRDGRLSAGSWARRRSPLATWQLHVALFQDGADAVDVFAHREYSWLRHPYRHYTCEGWDTEGGVERVRSLLADHDVTFRIDRRRAGTTDSVAADD
ncbi:hypothetical protein HTZ84_13665 [Haloterrigena sp. SYSU A558-1]|uniref:Uncharacterized protein n=1 Tax=Haloterrigena gelatinilytica TaxID=2741724 RepID=A0A8J8KB13_9EURY|nr:hypothetical protein [Haloterrigena gelatinilytica]NUB90835.1 hypothetical protein [Haloterrigena gelatinilytica]NUC73346.1 hypothetical protein [Haloterrigena gelatinilytica]